ncbi:OsmC family protein [Prosthecobacter vanneervenii]|uniref:Organic hydroperoxide reductase OsmC/OhrA n=1 Tax=Prosthecobacter vanneervenii TaxID=48466 RepID=A0A7W7YA32_9BACT|nr:OsmC family protein [Prosthecobacter vanneervenii]MBB5032407.1 organic hydroperoxide reductase OsmC/OhrA [Prosthecobacter vanneervenii]
MSTHTATIRWKNQGPDFLSRRYSREHALHFDGGAVMPGSPSPHIVPAPWSNPAGIDPEELFVASVSSCHMLWFLHVACDAGFLPESYEDAAEGIMTQNERGVLWISRITLHPKIIWGGEKQPSATEVEHLHHLAHEQCFIANSIKTDVIVQPEN